METFVIPAERLDRLHAPDGEPRVEQAMEGRNDRLGHVPVDDQAARVWFPVEAPEGERDQAKIIDGDWAAGAPCGWHHAGPSGRIDDLDGCVEDGGRAR